MDFLLPHFYTGLLPVYFFVKAKGLQPGVDRMLKHSEPPTWICSGTLAERFSWTAKAWGRGHGLRIVCWILANLFFSDVLSLCVLFDWMRWRVCPDALRNLALDCQVCIICPYVFLLFIYSNGDTLYFLGACTGVGTYGILTRKRQQKKNATCDIMWQTIAGTKGGHYQGMKF